MAGADPNIINDEGETAIRLALDSPEKVLMILNAGADIHIRDDHGWDLLMHAARGHQHGGAVSTEILAILKAVGADLDHALISSLVLISDSFINLLQPWAVISDLIKLMIELGANINGTDLSGRTALIRATYHQGENQYFARRRRSGCGRN